MITVRDATRDLLRELDLTTVFGNPGSTEIGFLRDWPEDFRYVLGLQESVVVAMADGYASATGKVVLVNLHSAGGVGHGLGQVFNSYRHNTPLIVVAGQQVRSLLQSGQPFLAADDAANFPRPYVKWACEPARAQDVPAALLRAYHLSTQAPYGPTFVSVPADDWDAEAEPLTVRPARLAGYAPDPDAIAACAAALEASERPAIVVGPAVDVDGAVPEVVTLAERTRAAVWSSPHNPRCSFPEDHPLFQGFLQPEARAVASALAGHDLVVVLGAPVFIYHVFRGAADPLPPVYLISEDEQLLARAQTGVGIRATLRLGIRALTDAIGPASRSAPKPRALPDPPAERTPIPPATVFTELAQRLPKDAILVEEIPSHQNIRRAHLPIRATRTGGLNTASGALGYGLPAAVGAAIGRPDRRVVGVIGDGSSMYSIQALWTAARENVPVTVIIMDNAGYAAVTILAGADNGAKVPGDELGGIDFTALATGMGCAAHRVETPDELRSALDKALASDRPTLLHVLVDPDPPALY